MKSIFIISFVLLTLTGCSSSLSTSSHYSDGDECSTGSLGCPCYGNGTCDNDLSCVDDTCVDPTNLDGDLDYDHESYADAENVLDSDTDNLLCVSGECCQDGLPVPTGEPCLTGQDSLDCTDDVCNANHACVHNLQEGKCLIQNICYDSNEDNPSTFCQFCDPLTNQHEWQNKQNYLSCDDEDPCSTDSECQDGICTGMAWVENDCSEYMECGTSPSGCYNCGTCDVETQICWECDSSIQSCWPGEGIDTKICAPDKGGSCGDMSGLQAGSPWPMFGGCPTHQGRSNYAGPQTPVLKWKRQTEERFYTTPILSKEGYLYAGNWGYSIYSLWPNGAIRWKNVAGHYVSSVGMIGINGDVYFNSYDGNDAIFSFDSYGKENWRHPMSGKIHPWGLTMLDGEYLLYGANAGVVAAIRLDTGEQEWMFETGARVFSVVTDALDNVYFTSNGILYCLDSGGNLLWNTNDTFDFEGNPAVGKDGTIYITGAENAGMYAIDQGGTVKWTYSSSSYSNKPAIGDDGTIYYGTRKVDDSIEGKLYALYPDGTLRWIFDLDGDTRSTPTIDVEGTVYIGSGTGRLYAVNPDGTEKWTYDTGAEVHGTVAIDTEGTVYFGSLDWYLYALQDGCTPNESWCGADNLYTCNETGDGLAGDPVDCPGGCNWGSCMDKGSMLSEIRYHGASIPVSDSIGFDSLNLTIEFWLKTGYPKTILYKGEYFRDSTNYTVRLLDCADDDSCNLFFGMRYEGVDYSWRAPVEKDQTVWRHFAVVADNESQSLKMFMNGSELTLTEFPENWPAGMLRTNEALKINMLEGIYYIDELRISDVPRYSENFIPPLRHVPDGNTQLLLHFDEGTGDVVHDSSPYENHGELTGSASWSEDVPGGTR